MMKLKTYIPFALILLLPALLPEAAALRAQTSRNSFLKVSVGDIRYVDKAQNKKQTVGSILTDLATTAVTGKSTTQHDEYAPSVREAIVKALSDVTRFRVIDGDFHFNELAGNEETLYVDGTINSITGTSQVTPLHCQRQAGRTSLQSAYQRHPQSERRPYGRSSQGF